MCVNVKIQYGSDVFALSLENQHTAVVENGTAGCAKLVEIVGRMTKAVQIETSNEFGVEFLDISKFDNQLGGCLRNVQKKFFGISEEGEERFKFFRCSTQPKDKERYQRMLEGYWKPTLEEKKKEEGGKIIIVDADDFVRSAEFRAMCNSDRTNYYVILLRRKLRGGTYEAESFYEFEVVEDAYQLKRR